MMKKILGLMMLVPFLAMSQKPFINTISPTHIEVGQTLNLSGTNLGGATSRVFFGGVEATSVTGNANSLQAIVPPGVTHGFVTVLNTTSNLIGQSSQQFFISFSGSDIGNYDPEYFVPTTEQAASDICMCDLDGDNLNDLVILHNIQTSDGSQAEFTVYRNNTAGTDAFSGTDFQLTSKVNNSVNLTGFISVSCRDLDNNGQPDLVFTSNVGTNQKDLYVYRNQSVPGTISINPLDLNLQLPNTSGGTGRIPRAVRTADMDGDGKLDLVVGNDTDNTFHVFRNTSTPGSFSFAAPVEHQIAGETTGLIELADLDADGITDVISMPFRTSSSGIYIAKNISNIDNIRFSNQTTITNGGQTSGVSSGDFDNDGLIDVVVASRNSGRITTFRNSTTASAITFESGETLTTTGNSPFGVDLGDMNGDGKLDIISSYAVGNIYVFENTSSTNNVAFGNEQVISTNSNTTQYVVVGDLNNDAKPDIAYTRDVQVNVAGDLGILLNRNCIVPVISPANLEFCLNDDFTVYATKTLGATYNWSITTANGANPADTDDDAVVTITSGSTATVQVTITQDGCVTQGSANFTILGGVQPTAPTFPSPSNQICVGDNLDITVNGGPYVEFIWTKPDGSTVTTTTNTLSLTGATASDGGLYTVRAKPNSGCFSEESTAFSLVVSQPPSVSIFNNGLDDICITGSGVTLEIPASLATDNNITWRLNGSAASGTNNGVTYTATQGGTYTVLLTDKVDGCTNVTDGYLITAVSEPVSSISGASETCAAVETTYMATSTGAGGYTLEYSWLVDGSPVTPTSPTQLDVTFPTQGAHTVSLITSYPASEVAACSDRLDFNVTVSTEPVTTFSQADVTEKCQADVVPLALTSPAAATIASYSWTLRNADATNALISTTPTNSATFDVTTPTDIDSVYAVVEIQTTIGCTVKDSILVKNFPTDADISSPDFPTIVTDDSALLEDAVSINLVAENVVSNIAWEPADQMDDATAANVTFFPQGPSTVVTLSGTDANGCAVTSQVTIDLDNLRPRKTFSPNGDGLNDCWEILNIGDLGAANGCKVYIFDARGRNLLVQDTFDQVNCVWNGTSGGGQVPEGVYYFVLKCNDDSFSKSGSILLAR